MSVVRVSESYSPVCVYRLATKLKQLAEQYDAREDVSSDIKRCSLEIVEKV